MHSTDDIAGATVEANTHWGGKCILFDNGSRLRIDDNPAIENADRITVEAWVNTLSRPARAVVCRKEGSYILYNFSGGFSWYLFGPENRLQHDIAGTLGNGSWGYIVGTYDKDAGAEQPAPLSQRRACRAHERHAAHRSQRSCPWHRTARERHRRPLQRPYRCVPHLACPALRWLESQTHLEQHERPLVRSPQQEPRSSKAANRCRWQAQVWWSV